MILFLLATLFATLITPLVIRLYRAKGWVQHPQKNKNWKDTHKEPLPRGGGTVIFIVVAVLSLFFLRMNLHLIAILCGAALLSVVGFLDDIYDIHPMIRLFTGLVAALLVVGSGIGIPYVTNPFGPGVIHLDQPQLAFYFMGSEHQVWILADFIAILFILWNMNIVNWSKGLDGQMPGFVAIALVFVGLLSQKFLDDPSQFNTAYLSFIVAGAFAGFLVWNFYPQKIMAGYGAGSLAGYFLAILSILSGAKFATTIMVLAIPTADAIFTIARRMYAGKSPLWGDRGHLHHKLMDVLGWGKRRIAFFYWVTTFVMGLLSLYLNTISKLATIGLVWILVFGFLFWAKIQSKRRI